MSDEAVERHLEREHGVIYAWASAGPCSDSPEAVHRMLHWSRNNPSHEHEVATSTGADLIAAERQRQISVEGWTAEHDDMHGAGRLCVAARCYVSGSDAGWPWDPEWWKPKTRPRNLVRAGALYQAAIDCIARSGGSTSAVESWRDDVAAELDEWLTFTARDGEATE